MTVHEVITLLSTFDPELEVYAHVQEASVFAEAPRPVNAAQIHEVEDGAPGLIIGHVE